MDVPSNVKGEDSRLSAHLVQFVKLLMKHLLKALVALITKKINETLLNSVFLKKDLESIIFLGKNGALTGLG